MDNTLVWEKGRQLKQYGSNIYKYNNDGIRIKKTTSSEIHKYILDGTNIVKEINTTALHIISTREVHHIVAQTDRRAEYSRKVINSYLIFVWHPVNLVTISKTLHKHLHTNAYFAAVDLCMAFIKFTTGGFVDTRLRIMAMLLTIAAILKVSSQAI